MEEPPFCGTFSAGGTIAAIPDYKIRLRGMLVSVLPAEAVTGPVIIEVTGLASNNDFGFRTGVFQAQVLPSTTAPVNQPFDFGSGVESIATDGVVLSLAPNGSDTLSADWMAWGEYVPL